MMREGDRRRWGKNVAQFSLAVS
jgi:single stranded DNA-binding protein